MLGCVLWLLDGGRAPGWWGWLVTSSGTPHEFHGARITIDPLWETTLADLRDLVAKAEQMGAPASAVYSEHPRHLEIQWTRG